jgi:pimeloyl-ACP methyl ester carboxylesterase
LIGHSWGAWLSWIFTARYPDIVRKLILVGSGPFEEKYAQGITITRLNRLSENERAEVFSLIEKLHATGPEDKNEIFTRFGNIVSKADTFDRLPVDEGEITYDAGMYQAVWKEAEGLRHSGGLLELGRKIRCPVIAIHGDYDPHPAEGVEKPLRHVLYDFKFILLNRCGHSPWVERQAREEFYRILRPEITNSDST